MRFRIGKVNVSAVFFFFAAAAYFLSSVLWKNYLWAVLFSSLHECGHMGALRVFHCPVESITIGTVGIRIDQKDLPLSYGKECVVAICGPLLNLICMAVCLIGKRFSSAFSLPLALNLGLFVINMLPVEPLDGGRILRMLLLMKSSPEKAEKVLEVSQTVIVILLIAVLLLSLIFDFVNTSFVLFVGGLVVMIVSRLIFPGKYAKKQRICR